MACCNWTPEVANVVSDILNTEGEFISGSPYSKRKKKHIITEQLGRVEGDPPQLLVGLNYDASDLVESWRVPKEDQREGEFASHIVKVNATFDMLCNIEFEFSEVDESSLWFPLPSRIGGSADLTETFEIVGVRAVKLADEAREESGYNFSLDRHPNGGVFLDLFFPMSGAFTVDLPVRVLNEGLKIARKLVGFNAATSRAIK